MRLHTNDRTRARTSTLVLAGVNVALLFALANAETWDAETKHVAWLILAGSTSVLLDRIFDRRL